MTKRIIRILLAILLVVTMVACENTSGGKTTLPPNSTVDKTTTGETNPNPTESGGILPSESVVPTPVLTEVLLLEYDFGETAHTGYLPGELSFTNKNGTASTLNKDRVQINTSSFKPHNDDFFLVFSLKEGSSLAWVEFDLSELEDLTKLTFRFNVWNNTLLNDTKNVPNGLFTLQIKEGGNWESLKTSNNETNLLPLLKHEEYVEVSYELNSSGLYRIIYSGTSSATNNTTTAVTVDDVRIYGLGEGVVPTKPVDPTPTPTDGNGLVFPAEYMAYYYEAEDLYGSQLESVLATIIKNHKLKDYDDARWALEDSDRDLVDRTKIYSIYDGYLHDHNWNVNGVWNEIWNREHVWPQLYLPGKANSSTKNVASDVHNLRANTTKTNSSRGNLTFSDASGSYGAKNGGWYPGDDHIGDVARIVFYMSVRWDLNITSMGSIDMFVRWHYLDPVDAFEIQRNNVIFEHQGNRNPFIDHPEFVNLIWNLNN